MEEYTDGRYAVDVYTNAALGSGSQLTSTEMTQKGTIDMVLTSTAILSNMDGNFYAFDMPWLVEDLDWVDENLVAGSKLFDLASEKAEGIGFKLLAFAELGYREFTNSKRTIETPADMAGLKVRSPGAIGLAAYTLLGCNATSIDFGELYTRALLTVRTTPSTASSFPTVSMRSSTISPSGTSSTAVCRWP
mgnify:CR=1 FL=1